MTSAAISTKLKGTGETEPVTRRALRLGDE
jgi:hypothetical protein